MNEMVYCRGCGKEIHKTAIACPSCGAPQRAPGGGKNKVTAALLAFFLGGLGVHRFYLGQWWGIFYLLFCWTLIPGLIAVIECIVFLCTSDQSWDARYNNGLQSGGGSAAGMIIAIVVCVFGGIALLGILAAIAVPAYQDYTIRAKMYGVESDGDRITAAFTEYYKKNSAIPADISALGVTQSATIYVQNIDIDQKTGVISMEVNIRPLAGQHLLFVPHLDAERNMTWTCGSNDMNLKYVSPKCQNK